MKYIIVCMLFLATSPLLAKRIAPPDIQPLEYDGIRYTAPNDNGRVAYLEAYDIQTGEQLWVTKVFRNIIIPWIEHDAQLVYIRKLEVVQNKLIVTNEKGKIYKVDLKTGRIHHSRLLWVIGIAALAIMFFIGIRLIKKKV